MLAIWGGVMVKSGVKINITLFFIILYLNIYLSLSRLADFERQKSFQATYNNTKSWAIAQQIRDQS